MKRFPLFLSLTLGSAAFGWPVDQRVEVEAGKETFVRVASVDWAWMETPSVAKAEALESEEVLVTGVSPGRTRLLLGAADGKRAVWAVKVAGGRSSVSEGAAPPELAATAKARCPKWKEEGGKLQVTVPNDACRRALLPLFQTDRYLSTEVTVMFEVPALQAQLRDIEVGLAEAGLSQLSARYVGAGLVLEGEVPSESAHARALWVVFDRSVGRVALDDRVRREPAPDAGGEKTP